VVPIVFVCVWRVGIISFAFYGECGEFDDSSNGFYGVDEGEELWIGKLEGCFCFISNRNLVRFLRGGMTNHVSVLT